MSKIPDLFSEQIRDIKSAVGDLSEKVYNLDKNTIEHQIVIGNQLETSKTMCVELRRMNDILQQNTNSLIDHMHRTGLLENAVEAIDKRLSPIEIERLKSQAVKSWLVDQVMLASKMVGGVTGAFAVYFAVIKILAMYHR